MDDDIKRELVRTGVPAVGVPLLQAGLNHHFSMKQIEKQKEMEVEMAERRQQGMEAMAAAKRGEAGAAGPVRRSDPVGGSPGDVYDDLEELREETSCGFCHNVIDELMSAPPDEARQGYDELRSYVRETERIKDRGVSQDEAEQIVGDLVDRWEIVPKHAAGMT